MLHHSIELLQKVKTNEADEFLSIRTADEEPFLKKSYTEEDFFSFVETFEKDIGVRRYRSD